MGDQQVGDALHGAGARDGVHTDHDSKNEKDRHHDLGDPLNAVFHTHIDDSESESKEDAEPEFRGAAVRDEISEKCV